MPHPAAAYWNGGVHRVPDQTGASALLDAQDIPVIMGALGVPLPFASCLDVGCGTGRASRHALAYLGVDIARDAVDYCLQRGLVALLIDGPEDLRGAAIRGAAEFSVVLALSVFTHIDTDERRAYLDAFRFLAPRAVVDIVPGDGSGDVPCWTADPQDFVAWAWACGWNAPVCYDRPSPEGVPHRYYRLERR